jgi:hypothetical protein
MPRAARLCALEIVVCAAHVTWLKGGPPFPVSTWYNVLRQVKRADAIKGLRHLEKAGLAKVWRVCSPRPIVQPIIPPPGDEFMLFVDWLFEPWCN